MAKCIQLRRLKLRYLLKLDKDIIIPNLKKKKKHTHTKQNNKTKQKEEEEKQSRAVIFHLILEISDEDDN